MRRACLLLLATAAIAFQRGDIPPTDDPTHPGQPAFCINYHTKEFKANCECKARARIEGMQGQQRPWGRRVE